MKSLILLLLLVSTSYAGVGSGYSGGGDGVKTSGNSKNPADLEKWVISSDGKQKRGNKEERKAIDVYENDQFNGKVFVDNNPWAIQTNSFQYCLGEVGVLDSVNCANNNFEAIKNESFDFKSICKKR